MAYRRKDEGGFWTSWGLIIALFVLGLSPVALILMLVKLFRKDRREMEEIPSLGVETRYTVDTRINKPRQVQGTVQAQPGKQQEKSRQESRPAEAMRRITKSPAPKKSTIVGLTIGGGFLALIGISGMGDVLDAFTFSDLMFALSFLLGGGAMLLKSVLLQKDGKRYAKYLAMIADREAVYVEELAKISGEPVKQVEKDLDDMVEKGFFGDGAYLNRELGCLFRDNAADQAWREKHQEERAKAVTPQEANEGYSGILRNIRRANDEIADPGLSAKIEQLENITARIFRAVEEDPKKAEKIDTFLNYYLPTTQKLLDSYAQFEAAGVEGENLSQAKARISDTMDMILQGFSRQLDQLYQADAMDVDTDIRVMESMLRRDTRTVADDFYGSSVSGKTTTINGKPVSGGSASGRPASGGPASGGPASSRLSSGGTASGGPASGRPVSSGQKSGGPASGKQQSARFGQSLEEDFGGLAAQKAPEDQ